ncbi:hypothetical protein JTE90_000581 [Oedothorax gibbosus]|uniref:Eukaryotic translation initiation factor 4E-binding protein Mextli n=1 Tax=Oedothorax gibbosus TaxID=931172 RepID=A0AAV6VUU4_9ARAC|nr:hypothetical protein JTE90_000581 [Oedothorax gibbosus]
MQARCSRIVFVLWFLHFSLSCMNMNNKPVRIREPLKKPRPLKSASTSDVFKVQVPEPKDYVIQKSREEILADLEILNLSISDCNFDEVTITDISRMCAILKKRGEELDSHHKDAIDRYFCTLRNACREERLDMASRIRLLEVIERRARGWKNNENINNYFNMKIMELEHKGPEQFSYTAMSPTSPFPVIPIIAPTTPSVVLSPGEILRSSGKFEKPTKISGKNYFKDEILIRNSDSGKVNPGARDRLVQITGPHEESISHAKVLVEDTIRRNASPVRDNTDLPVFDNRERVDYGNSFSTLDNQSFMKRSLQHSYSLSDASIREYSIPLQIGQDVLTLTGTNSDLLQSAKSVLKAYFAGELEMLGKQPETFAPLNRQPSLENMQQRYELRRQSSLKLNMENNSSSWNLRRDSVSPFSSSEDGEDRRIGLERAKAIQDMPSRHAVETPMDISNRHSVSSDSSIVNGGKFSRSASVPNEPLTFPDIAPPVHNDAVFSPLLSPESEILPIPPPSYKKNKYSREFLLTCAKSPYSHNQPKDYALIHQNCKDIINQAPVMFDPEKYEASKLEESTVAVLK